ncbi:MAG: hypothetical protein AUG49_03285 [Catenulispora sp. 13_1_20CM_3_70_7]|jgi:hypothetical protein|nr:MAG: hypothetical protein AUG49_03285 [Catenulispora sp. 13_1_20CM_3_70_7]
MNAALTVEMYLNNGLFYIGSVSVFPFSTESFGDAVIGDLAFGLRSPGCRSHGGTDRHGGGHE